MRGRWRLAPSATVRSSGRQWQTTRRDGGSGQRRGEPGWSPPRRCQPASRRRDGPGRQSARRSAEPQPHGRRDTSGSDDSVPRRRRSHGVARPWTADAVAQRSPEVSTVPAADPRDPSGGGAVTGPDVECRSRRPTVRWPTGPHARHTLRRRDADRASSARRRTPLTSRSVRGSGCPRRRHCLRRHASASGPGALFGHRRRGSPWHPIAASCGPRPPPNRARPGGLIFGIAGLILAPLAGSGSVPAGPRDRAAEALASARPCADPCAGSCPRPTWGSRR